MTVQTAKVCFDVSPESAIEAIRSHEGPILVDLDETLYLRNSTEDFLDCAQPGLLALVMLRCLDVLKPWRFTGGENTRDAWRVRLVILLLPWVGMRWRGRTGALASEFVNHPLMDALQAQRNRPIIVTAGFLPVVTPLIAALGLRDVTIVASRGFGFADRRHGKLHVAVEVLGSETVRKSLVITDSELDNALLEASARPLLTVWPKAEYRRALGRVYLPGEYATKVKHPGERYLFRGIFQEDFVFWVIATVGLAAMPIFHILGLSCLLVSFWAIYERGYVDNDQIAAKFESDPKLSAEFHTVVIATPVVQPWIWAACAGSMGIFLLRLPFRPVPQDFVIWAGVLVATHGWFKLYNRVEKSTRIWMYPLLQFARSAAPIALVPVSLIGALALGAQVLARWVPYYIYRVAGKDWPNAHTHLIRVVFFLVLAMLLMVAGGPAAVLNWTTAALLLWSLFRARHEIITVISAARLLDRG